MSVRAWADEAGGGPTAAEHESVSHTELQGLPYSHSLLTSGQTLQGGPRKSKCSEFCHRLKKQHREELRAGPEAELGPMQTMWGAWPDHRAHHVMGMA